MVLTEIATKNALHLLDRLPACHNYHDSLIAQSTDYLQSYKFFRDSTKDIFGISPDLNIHLYSHNTSSILNFANHLKEIQIQPKVFFSFYGNDSLLRSITKNRNLTARPFYYLNKAPIVTQNIDDSLECRLAKVSDQALVNLWYEKFNEEEQSNWEVPNLTTNPNLKLYLFFSKDEFIGAAANTLLSLKRLWIGRLWIAPSMRNRNLGTAVMKKLENVAKEENKTMSLLVSNHNVKALGLYKKLNYKMISSNSYWY
jgi:GNAT superfamily N-acetyltransferase